MGSTFAGDAGGSAAVGAPPSSPPEASRSKTPARTAVAIASGTMTPRVRRGAASAGSEGCDREMPSPVEGGGSLARVEGGAELAPAGRDGMAAGSAAGARDALDAESAGGAELGSGVEAGRGTLEGGAGVEAALALSAARTESGPELKIGRASCRESV